MNTEFFLSHADLPAMRVRAARSDRRWDLGDIAEGEEWFACTFGEQLPTAISDDRVAELLTGSDEAWMHAYEGMTLDGSHGWSKFAPAEVEAILQWTGLKPGEQVLDVGCGVGRHAAELARRGYVTFGVDISRRFIEQARNTYQEARLFFGVGDCRDLEQTPPGPFQMAVCLYDVIGSSARVQDDEAILRNVRDRLVDGGWLALTVMNSDAILDLVPDHHRPASVQAFIQALEVLAPSHTMEQSGDIFNPQLLVYYDGIYYRKEQFDVADWRLPVETVVRDLRYTQVELRRLLRRCGFHLEFIWPVQAGQWTRKPKLSATDRRAKELVAVARRQ